MQNKGKIFGGYLQAVLAATALFLLFDYIKVLEFPGDGYPRWERMVHLLGFTYVLYPVMVVIIFLLAAIPFWLVIKIAARYSLHSRPYYIICGGLAGLIATLVSHEGMLQSLPAGSAVSSMWPEILRISMQSIPSGALGGYVYWRKVRSFYTARGNAA